MINAFHTARRAMLSLAAALLVAACSSSPPKPTVDFKPDYNFSQVKTIAFYHRSGQVSGDNPMQLSDIQRNRIDEALAFALRNKGYQIIENASQADILVSWHLATQHKTDVRTYETPAYGGYYGYGPYNRYSRYSCWSCMPTQTEVSVQDYTEGTFIVDMIDPALNKSVWRSVVQSKLKGKVETDQGKYNAAAERIMADFPSV
jgi:hypothetical protein